MIFVDTHTHLYDEAFDADREPTINRALQVGVSRMLLPAIDSNSTSRLLDLCHKYPSTMYGMAGLHPTSVKENFEEELSLVKSQLSVLDNRANPQPDVFTPVAVGEIGLDFYWDRTFATEQQEALLRQMRWAIERDLPVSLHVRKAHSEFFSLIKKINRPHFNGVMHCFGGGVNEAVRAVEMGFKLGIGGVVTFKNAQLQEVVKAIPLEHLLLETDAPYLSPTPNRGKRNESSYIPIIAQAIAELKGISIEQVAEQTTNTAQQLFNIA